MRIVIDMQGAQTGNRFRGIGRYTMEFAKAVVRNRGEHEVILVLSGLFPETIEPIRAAFDGLLPQENLRVWHAPGPVRAAQEENDTRREVAELIREAFLASLKPDVIHTCSLVEGHGDDAVTSIGRFDIRTPVSVTLYDLIPLIHQDVYLQHPGLASWYREKIDHLRRANLLLAISSSTAQEAEEYLGFDKSAIVSVGTDCGPFFRPIDLTIDDREKLRTAYGIERPFVMYTGGIDHRKNLDRMIHAYAALPLELRRCYQLAIVCAAQPADRDQLSHLAHEVGLAGNDLVLTGYVSDDDLLLLYNACAVFIFPSWHEGFGLPVLEAMRCGKAVIASNTSSLPELVGREDALFDPFDTQAITRKIAQVLTDDALRKELEQHSLVQARKFSWDKTAKIAWNAWKSLLRPKGVSNASKFQRPRLAYVSPLPPERSGVADYSAELLPYLARWYEIDVVVTQSEVSDTWIRANCSILSVEAFRACAGSYDRVLYHFGNSSFHHHMFALLDEIPGVVVLHDFYLSGIQAWREAHQVPHAWAQALYVSHGYSAVHERYTTADMSQIIWRYPANLPVLQRALGVIVHSEYSRTLAQKWYGGEAGKDWAVIPLLRTLPRRESREAARKALGLALDDLLVCSFGFIGPTKLSHRLLAGWLASPLAKDSKAHLVFVGEKDPGHYGQQLSKTIASWGNAKRRIHITGYVDAETYCRYLAAADIGVQLRTLSRGESPKSVLDCMSYGLATLVNAHGSLAELDPRGVWMLRDDFREEELIEALVVLARDLHKRHAIGTRARQIVQDHHAPQRCAAQYFEAIERFYQRAACSLPGLITRLGQKPLDCKLCFDSAVALARNFPAILHQRQLLVDISTLVQQDFKTGIQRVVRSILRQWLLHPPAGWRVEPVYATPDQPYRYARIFTARFLGMPAEGVTDEPIDYAPGDCFFVLDLHFSVQIGNAGFYQQLRQQGVAVKFLVYDLLIVQHPECFVAGAKELHERWLRVVSDSDGAICISKATADALSAWVKEHGALCQRPLVIDWFHLGADIDRSVPTKGLPAGAEQTLAELGAGPSFLMVGTLEPRKGHAQVLAAFERLWEAGKTVKLVIVGKPGWMVEGLIERLRIHPELNRRLFWLEGISDEYLEKIYAVSTCFIAASINEGFGLPLIEAARHKLPIIARDIPVFREVAGEHAYYFDAASADELAEAIKAWLGLYQAGQHPRSDDMPWLTWRESAENLAKKILTTGKTVANPDIFDFIAAI